jgi:phosphoribosylaminoimidazole carboxylase PurE protein
MEEPAAPGVEVKEPITETDLASEFDGLDVDAPRVGIVAGSRAEMEAMVPAEAELEERAILFETRVMCPPEEAEMVTDYARNAKMRGLRVIIAAATPGGASGGLPGLIARHGELPVVGVPLPAEGSDPADMGGGLVAWMALGAAREAAVFAARIIQ